MRDGRSDGVSDGGSGYVVVGPPTHGVVVHGLRLAGADARLGAALVRVDSPSGVEPPGLVSAVPAGGGALLHVTDRLFGPTPEHAVGVVDALAARARLALVLHDVPQAAEGGDWYARRRAAYARLASLATLLVVASASEADQLVGGVDPPDRQQVRRRTTVVPLPVERAPSGRQPDDHAPVPAAGRRPVDLAVLGFLYPGKGVEDAIDIAAALTTDDRAVTVTNDGAAAEGHADYAEELERYAAARGVSFRLTGYLTDADLRRAVLGADVPLAPHRHISASGSVNTWLEAGRRPVVRRSPYVDELAARLPGVVVAADDLQGSVAAAVADPATTWLADDVEVGPSWAEAAAAHVDVLQALT